MYFISKFIFNYIWRWKFEGQFPHHIPKFVIIAAPHTSWVDFPLGLLVKWTTKLEANYIGKNTLFKPPFGFIFKALGGTPVDRSKNNNLVDAVIEIFNRKEIFRLVLSPEGTRKKVDKWKTGFYYIAKGANVPIIMLAFDFEHRKLIISEPYYLSEDMGKDFEHFHKFYEGIKGYNVLLT